MLSEIQIFIFFVSDHLKVYVNYHIWNTAGIPIPTEGRREGGGGGI